MSWFFLLMFNTFLLRPAMSREIQRCVPFLSRLRLASMNMKHCNIFRHYSVGQVMDQDLLSKWFGVLPDGLLSMFMPHTFKCSCQVHVIQP